MSERPDHDSIILSPVEQKYLATCYPLPDRPFIEEANKWKVALKESSQKNHTVTHSRSELGRAFPHLGTLHKKGFFNDRSIQSYFEGTDSDSHNMRMYLFAKRLAREHLPAGIMNTILEHLEACSVKVARIMSVTGSSKNQATGKIWSYGETYNDKLDLGYLNPALDTSCVFVHGRTENGLIVVRDAGPDFEPFKEWFKEKQKNGGGKLFKK